MNEKNITTRKYSDAAEHLPKKPQWNGKEKKAANGTPYGKKIYDVRIPEQRESAVCEIIVRKYLVAKRISCVTESVSIKPKEVAEFLNKMDNSKVRDNFFDACEKLKKFLDDKEVHTITLHIEMGQTSVAEDMSRIANKFDEIDAIKLIKNVFVQINEIHSENALHLDIKPDNMVWSKDGKRTILLNDFDTSVVLRPLEESHYDDEPSITLRYAAPEQLGLYGCELSKKTDIFSASLIAFQICSEGKIPERLNNIKNNHSLSKDEYIDKLRETFNDISVLQEKGKCGWELPKHGSDELKKIILSGLNVNPDKRPTAAEIIGELDKIYITEDKEMKKDKQKNIKNVFKFIEIHVKKGNSRKDESIKKGWRFDAKNIIIFTILFLFLLVYFLNSIFDLFNNGNNTDSHSIDSVQATFSSEEPDTISTETLITTTINSLTYTEPITTTIATEEKSTESSGNNNNNSGNDINLTHNGMGDINVKIGDTYYNDEDNESSKKTNETDSSVETSPPVTEPPTEPATTKPERKQFKVTLVNYNGYEGYEINGFDLGFDGGELYIPSQIDGIDIIGIGENAFKENTEIKKIYFPATLRYIGNNAFEQCQELTEIIISENVEVIGEKSFFDCLNIENVFVPYNTVEIGAEAFGVSVEASSAIDYSKDRCFNVDASNPWKYPNRIDEHIFGEFEVTDDDNIVVNFR